MEVSAIRLVYCPESLEWMLRFFMDSDVNASMPDENRTLSSVYEAGKALETGCVIGYLPIVNGECVGLFWGKFFGPNTIEGHWGILKQFRSKGVSKACCDAVFEQLAHDFPEVTNVIGMVSKSNLRSYAGALKAGFKCVGTLPNSFRRDGKLHDSWIIHREVR